MINQVRYIDIFGMHVLTQIIDNRFFMTLKALTLKAFIFIIQLNNKYIQETCRKLSGSTFFNVIMVWSFVKSQNCIQYIILFTQFHQS